VYGAAEAAPLQNYKQNKLKIKNEIWIKSRGSSSRWADEGVRPTRASSTLAIRLL